METKKWILTPVKCSKCKIEGHTKKTCQKQMNDIKIEKIKKVRQQTKINFFFLYEINIELLKKDYNEQDLQLLQDAYKRYVSQETIDCFHQVLCLSYPHLSEKYKNIRGLLRNNYFSIKDLHTIADSLLLHIKERHFTGTKTIQQKSNTYGDPSHSILKIVIYQNHIFLDETTILTKKQVLELFNIPRQRFRTTKKLSSLNFIRLLLGQNYKDEITSPCLLKKLHHEILNQKLDIPIDNEYNNENIYKLILFDTSNINDESYVNSKTFKNIREIKECNNLRKVISYIKQMEEGPSKNYLKKYLYESYYEPKLNFDGNLTDRIMKIDNSFCYSHIMSACFDSYDIYKNFQVKKILNQEDIVIITDLHGVCSSLCGIFIDYLFRRVISELSSISFYDSRADRILASDNIITYIDEKDNIWEFIENDYAEYWTIRIEPVMSSEIIGEIFQGDTFIFLEKIEIWMKIKYKEIIGWVRHRLPKDENSLEMIQNQYLRKKTHICSKACKYLIQQRMPAKTIISCLLDTCQNISYNKTKNMNNPSKDILYDIFITSLCHTEFFGFSPRLEKVKLFQQKLNEISKTDFINSFTQSCKIFIKDNSNVILNPALGGKLNILESTKINSDADLVIDNNIFDIKCSNRIKNYRDFFQLLGYSSLIYLNKKYEIKINKMIVLNLLEGNYIIYNIEYLDENNFINFIKFLSKINKN